jgi:prepilin-type processing-associated H-X9-DG protein
VLGDSSAPTTTEDTAGEARLGEQGMGCDDTSWDPPVSRNHGGNNVEARSQHAGGVNCCFADGSVHFINQGMKGLGPMWLYLNSRNDNQPLLDY